MLISKSKSRFYNFSASKGFDFISKINAKYQIKVSILKMDEKDKKTKSKKRKNWQKSCLKKIARDTKQN